MMQFRAAACAAMLIIGSFYDLKSREVRDELWIASSALGVLFTAIDFFSSTDPILLIPLITSVLITVGLSAGLYHLNFFGGADAKALTATSLLLPLYHPPRHIHPITPIIILTNSAFITLILPIAFSTINSIRLLHGEAIFKGFESEPLRRKTTAFFLGYRTKRKGRFLFPLEEMSGGERRFEISLLRKDETFVDEADRWVTPGIPLLLFMLAAFFTMIFYGDILAGFYPSLHLASLW